MEVQKTIDPFGNTVYVPNSPQIDINECLRLVYTLQELERACGAKYGVTLAELVKCAPTFETRETEEYKIECNTNEDSKD